MGTAMSSFFGRSSRSQNPTTAITAGSPDSIPRDLADLLSRRFSCVWDPKLREYCLKEDLKIKMAKKRWRVHLFDFVLSLRKLKSILNCDTKLAEEQKSKMIPSKINSSSQENISQNSLVHKEINSQHQIGIATKGKSSPDENVQNVQNEKRLLCKQIYNHYFNEDSESYLYSIPLSNNDLRTQLSKSLLNDNTSNESLNQIINDTLEDSFVWIRLSELCDKFLKQSVLQSQNSPVAKSVAVLLSIL